MFSAFPKIFTLGQDYISSIFDDEVEITEKVDGSQFSFGRLNGELMCRSKGAQLFFDLPDNMFKLAVNFVKNIGDMIPDGRVYYGEYLMKEKHNVLKYSRVPKNNIILFGVCDASGKFYDNYGALASDIGLESVPVLYRGKINKADEIKALLEKDSILGGTKIEGMVIKNYNRAVWVGGQVIPITCGKFVSEAFKEVHNKTWSAENTSRGKYETYVESFRTDARWLKAIQHLKEKGTLENSPRDIGNLIKEIREDICAEEKENIMKFLWSEFSGEILRKASAGFPEWYKEYLLKQSFK